jgi:pyrroline-5-carboxylate reductase
MLDTLKLGFIGGGNMAAALIGGLIAKGAHGANIVVVDPTEPARARAEQSWGAHAAAAPGTELADRDVIVLAVKPQQMRDVCAQLAPHLGDSLVLSVAAGIRIQDLSRWLNGHARIVRAMPNTPALSGLGMTGLAANAGLSEADRATASAIANAVGKSLWVPAEAQIDAVTAISGSGPAYVSISSRRCSRRRRSRGCRLRLGARWRWRRLLGRPRWPGSRASRSRCCASG